MIENIILDYGRVLAYPKTGNWFVPPNTQKIIGFNKYLRMFVHHDKTNLAFRKAYKKLNDNHLLHMEVEELAQFTEFYKEILERLDFQSDLDSIAELLANDNVLNDDKVIFYDDVIDELKKFNLSYRVAILSDTWPSLKRVLDHNGVLQLTDGLIMSCDYGICKDRLELFEIAVKELGINPENSVFIDDSTANLKNAVIAGFKPILMDRTKKMRHCPYPVVHNLSEIAKVIQYYNSEGNKRSTRRQRKA